MKPQVFVLSLAASLLQIGPVSAGNNSPEPGTTGVHMTYNCQGDPMGCQNMCYYYYCLGRTPIGTGTGTNKKKRDNRSNSGYRHKIFDAARRAVFGTQVLGTAYTTPDEYPPASAQEGGLGASLIGHDTAYRTQGGRMSSLMTTLGTRQGWIEPYNWDPSTSPACNCKPNWPANSHYNPYGAQCDCDKDSRKKYIYHMTKDARSYKKAEFENWGPNVDWSTSKWNYQGYSKKRSLEVEGKNEEVARREAADDDERSSYDKEWLEEVEAVEAVEEARKTEEYHA